jgi:co-chaperonin GroES (HSP10)
MSNKYSPLEDRILIKPIKKTEPETTAGGIITDTIKKEVAEGLVVSAGQGFTARDTGVFVPTWVKKGDMVLYGVHAGMPIDIPNEEGGKDACLLMREGDILMLIKKAEQDS